MKLVYVVGQGVESIANANVINLFLDANVMYVFLSCVNVTKEIENVTLYFVDVVSRNNNGGRHIIKYVGISKFY